MVQDLHREHINVLKFAHHSPSLFVTSSFDKDIKVTPLLVPLISVHTHCAPREAAPCFHVPLHCPRGASREAKAIVARSHLYLLGCPCS